MEGGKEVGKRHDEDYSHHTILVPTKEVCVFVHAHVHVPCLICRVC